MSKPESACVCYQACGRVIEGIIWPKQHVILKSTQIEAHFNLYILVHCF